MSLSSVSSFNPVRTAAAPVIRQQESAPAPGGGDSVSLGSSSSSGIYDRRMLASAFPQSGGQLGSPASDRAAGIDKKYNQTGYVGLDDIRGQLQDLHTKDPGEFNKTCEELEKKGYTVDRDQNGNITEVRKQGRLPLIPPQWLPHGDTLYKV